MTTTALKHQLHLLIDSIENPDLLQKLYNQSLEILKSGKKLSWDSFTEAQQLEIMESFNESENATQLTSNDEVIKKYLLPDENRLD